MSIDRINLLNVVGAFDEVPDGEMLAHATGEEDASGDQPEDIGPSSTDPKGNTSDDSDEDNDSGNVTLETARSRTGSSLDFG